jgi:hypothetical protein
VHDEAGVSRNRATFSLEEVAKTSTILSRYVRTIFRVIATRRCGHIPVPPSQSA